MYRRAIQLSSSIGVTEDVKERSKQILEFKTLYYGELGLVESHVVEDKLVEFYNHLREDDEYLRHKALELSAVMRGDLAKSWGTSIWKPIRR